MTLTATNACGSDAETKVDYITVTCVAPVAAFTGSPTTGEAPLVVDFTDQSTGSPTSWSWNFGDGGTSTQQSPSYDYATAGTYTVTLTATNSCGSDDEVKTDYITVNEATGAWVTITYDDFEGGFGSYTDGGDDCYLYTGGSYAHQGSNAGAIQDNSGVASSFYHDVGHNVSGYTDLEIEFWFMAISMDRVTEDFWVQYYDGSTWHTVATYARSTDFDNGVFYNKVVSIPAGTYNYPANAQLRFMCDASGNQDDVYIDEVEFRGYNPGGPLPPTAEFTGTPTSGVVPLDVAFTDQSTGSPTSWSWTFGDGGTSTAQNPNHTYTVAGDYTVTLTATNSAGSDAETKINYISVGEPGAWTVITYDDFEGGFGNYTDGGGDCVLYTAGTYAHQGANAADIQDNSGISSSFYHTNGYNVSGYTELEVEFWFMAISMDNTSEDFWVQYFDGSAWQTVATYARGIDFDNGVFYNEVVTISSSQYNFPANAKLRFMCDASANKDDVYIDEIEFRGMGGARDDGGAVILTDRGEIAPTTLSLSQNYPNPFTFSTSIEFRLPAAADVSITVTDVTGRRVTTLADGHFDAGIHRVEWNAKDIASGVYFYRMEAGYVVETKRMRLLK